MMKGFWHFDQIITDNNKLVMISIFFVKYEKDIFFYFFMKTCLENL
jgi:hypothetical protein